MRAMHFNLEVQILTFFVCLALRVCLPFAARVFDTSVFTQA